MTAPGGFRPANDTGIKTLPVLTLANPDDKVWLLEFHSKRSTVRTNPILAAFASILLALGLQSGCSNAQSTGATSPPSPPVAPVRPASDDYFGTKVVDPYRYADLQDAKAWNWNRARLFGSQRMNSAVPTRTVEEMPRVQACCWLPATNEV